MDEEWRRRRGGVEVDLRWWRRAGGDVEGVERR